MKERLYKGFAEAEKALANNKFDKQSAEDVRHLITSVREEFGDKGSYFSPENRRILIARFSRWLSSKRTCRNRSGIATE